MKPPHPELGEQLEARPQGLKFTWSSGSRPLEGFTIKRGIGRGGFGEVYYGTSDGGKEVALKLIRRNLDVELRGVSQCLNLKHPNLLQLFDIRRDSAEDAWVVMEFVSGESLDRVIANHPQGMPLESIHAWMRGVCAGVAYLHDKGVVHRDLKPGNIFSDEGIVKIGDYGLSKFISTSRRSGQTESVGTVHYMAPEVANGRYGKEIDIYALGVMLHEMLTGRVPFDGESVGEVLMKHLTAEPDVSRLSEPYRAVVARSLAKDPEHRFRSLNEFGAAFLGNVSASDLSNPMAGVDLVPSIELLGGRSGGERAAGDLARGNGPDPGASPPALVEEEPLWRALREAGSQLSDAWRRANFHTVTKIVLLLVAGVFLLKTSNISVPAIGSALLAYGAYRLVRALLLAKAGAPYGGDLASAVKLPGFAIPKSDALQSAAPQSPTSPPRPPPLAPPDFSSASHKATVPHGIPLPSAAPTSGPRGLWGRKHCQGAVPAMIVKSGRERLTELLGSMLLSSIVSIALALVMTLLSSGEFAPNQFAWLAMVSTLGSWGVLVPAKFWEGTQGEPLTRRLVLVVAGMLLAGSAFALHEALFVDLAWGTQWKMQHHLGQTREGSFAPSGAPLWRGFLIYFGALFGILRWWRQADPLRASRLSIWGVGLPCLVAWGISLFWPFPQPWGVMLAASVSMAVQLSAPWLDARRKASA